MKKGAPTGVNPTKQQLLPVSTHNLQVGSKQRSSQEEGRLEKIHNTRDNTPRQCAVPRFCWGVAVGRNRGLCAKAQSC